MTLPRLAFVAALALGPVPALAAPFTIFIWETPEQVALRADPTEAGAAYWADFAAYGETLGGAMRGGAPLMVTPGDVTGDLILGGYFMIEAATLADAQALADRAPSVAAGGAATAVGHLPVGAM